MAVRDAPVHSGASLSRALDGKAGSQLDNTALKQQIWDHVEDHKEELYALSNYIYSNPEIAYNEHKAAAALAEILRKYGFDVEEKAGGLDTAFIAAACPTGRREPVIDILAEYDALGVGDSFGEGVSVAHACGHNLIATTAAGAGIALREIMEREGIPGTLRVVGTPAEESGGGKIDMQRAGIFDHTDAMLLLHPTSGVSKIAGRCKSSYKLRVKYTGVAAHAGSHPEDGVNALDAANICYTAIGCLRNQLPNEVQVLPLFTNCGTENFLIPDLTELLISIRAFSMTFLESALKKVRDCVNAGALATGCQVEITDEPGYQGRVCNHTLAGVLRENFEALGEPLMEGMVDDNGGEDFGNLNRVIPGVMPYPTLLPEKKISNHTPQFLELANSDKSREVILLGSRVMAYTALDMFQDTTIIGRAKAELKVMQEQGF